jgi:hypothetical protein
MTGIKDLTTNRRYGIIGTTGTGKSNTTYYLLDKLRRGKYPVIVLDHKGEYAGITDVHNVKARDVNPREMPIKLRNSGASVVIDLRGHDDAQGFVAAFIETCLKMPRQVPALVVIEEAHNYAPQKGKNPPSKIPINRMAAEGRSLGYGLLVVTQQCQKIDKDLISQAGALYIHRHQFKTDLAYLSELVGDEGAEQIRRLGTGEVYYYDLDKAEKSFFKMPLVKNKKIGVTPAAQTSKEVAGSWDQAPFWDAPPVQVPFLAAAPVQDDSQGSGSMGTGIIILSIIVVVVIIAAGVWLFKKWSTIDDNIKKIDPGGGLRW